MARQSINVGSNPNDKTGDPLRTAFTKINDNFTELYGASPFGQQVTISGNQISANASNADLVLSGSGTGGVVADAIRISGTSITSDDSTQIQINENLEVGGNITASGNITATGNIFANGNINLGNAASDQTKVVGVFEADQVQIDGTTITTNTTNGSLTITGNGSGGVNIDNLTFNDNTISSASNADINLTPGGTGNVVAGAVTINGTTLSAADSTKITVAEDVDVTGALDVSGTTTVSALTASGVATLSGTAVIDNITINDSTISTSSNADLNLTPGGTGSVIAGSLKFNGTSISSDDSTFINLNEAVNVTGTLTTSDIATTGTHTVTGQSDIDSVRIKDNRITTNATNANLQLSANGTGVVEAQTTLSTGDITTTGTHTITGQLNIDNIAISGNGIIATNSGGGININPNATGLVTIGGSTVEVPSTLLADTVYAQTQILMGSGAKIVAAVTNQDLVLEGGPGTGAVVIDKLRITDDDITSSITNGNIAITGNGTGGVTIEGITFTGTSLSSADSTQIQINEQVDLGGNKIVNLADPTADQHAATKGYVDTQLSSSSHNITFVGDDSTGTAVTQGETFKFAGTQNITTAVSGDTLTITGPDLTNYLQNTGTQTIDNISFNDNIISTASNADLNLNPGGTGQVVANSALKINKGYIEAINTLTSSSTITVDFSEASVHTVTLAENTQFVVTNLPTGGTGTIIITQDGGGSNTGSFGTDGSTAVKFAGGTPTLSTAGNAIDVVTIFNDGVNYLGNIAKAYAA